MDDDVLVQTDSRGRVSLGKLVIPDRYYLGRIFPDGTVVLEPAVVSTKGQDRLDAHPDLIARMEWNAAAPGRRVPRPVRPA